MTDDIDSALAERPSAATAVLPLAESIKAALAAHPIQSLSMRTPEDRRNLVALHAILDDLSSLVSARRRAVEMFAARHFAATGDKMLYFDEKASPLRYTPPGNDYVVAQPQKLREALLALSGEGLLTEEEADEAIHAEVTWKPNHSHLNALSRRSARLAAAIAEYRSIREDPTAMGKVTWPKR